MGTRSRLVVLGVLVVASVVAVALLVVRPLLTPTPVVEAVEQLPATVVRASFTDWALVQEAADGAAVDADSSETDIADFLTRAYDTDLIGVSSLSSTFPGLAENFGFTPLESEWEVYAQAEDGSAAVLKMEDDVDLEAVEGRFEGLGYAAPPDGAGEGETWVGEVDQVAGLPGSLTPVQENLAVLVDERLVVMGDDPAFVDLTVDAIRGDGERLDSVEGLGSLLGELEEPATAKVWASDLVCSDLAMSQANGSDRAEADRLVEEVGGVNPLTGFILAEDVERRVQLVFGFDSDEDASEDLQPRTDLASGPAPGQGGTFPERFEITSSVADGPVVSMELKPVVDQVLADLGQGPVLFATC